MPHSLPTAPAQPALTPGDDAQAAGVERALDLVFRHGPFALALIDRQGIVVHANPAYERLFGWSVDELRRMTFFDFTHPDDREIGVAEVAAMREGLAESATFSKRYLTRDGRLLWARVTVFPLHDGAGPASLTVAMVRDVTEEREAQRRAEDWRRRYETAILASRRVLYDWEIGTDTTVWAGACEATFGCTAAEMGSWQAWLTRVHPDDAENLVASVERALADRTDLRALYRFKHRSGEWIWIQDSSYQVLGEHGEVERMIGFVVDVSERVRGERERERQDDLFRRAAAVMNGMVWEWDLGTDRVWRSPEGLRQLLGYEPGEIPGTPDGWRAIVHPDDFARVDFRKPPATLESESEYRVQRRDGRWITVWDRAVVDRGPDGEARRLIGSTVDITNRLLAAAEVRLQNVELEARVAERTAELVRTNQELEAFTYSVSHDLRAPLRHVAGFAELLRQRSAAALDAESRRYLDLVLGASSRMGDLLDRLLDLSHLGRAPLEMTPVDVAALARELVAESAAQHRDRAIDWRIGAVPAVRADPALLRLVLSNLLQNAVKYTAARTPAVIELRGHALPDGAVEIVLEDNGVGFDMRYAHRLFGVFERLHPAGEYEGWGVGLASVQRIVARHGGTVRGHGEPDRGATFTVTLPAAEPTP
jgi:PAS domain S-box-containing protein